MKHLFLILVLVSVSLAGTHQTAQASEISNENPISDYHQSFFSAITEGDVEKLAFLLESDVDINSIKNEIGDSLLHEALILPAHPEIVEMLIEKGIDLDAQNKYDSTPLHVIALQLVIVAEGLLEVEDEIEFNNLMWIILDLNDAANFLVQQGANPDIVDENNSTFLDIINRGFENIPGLSIEITVDESNESRNPAQSDEPTQPIESNQSIEQPVQI